MRHLWNIVKPEIQTQKWILTYEFGNMPWLINTTHIAHVTMLPDPTDGERHQVIVMEHGDDAKEAITLYRGTEEQCDDLHNEIALFLADPQQSLFKVPMSPQFE